MTLIDTILGHAATAPGRLAFVDAVGERSYSRLAADVSELGRRITATTAPDSVVAVRGDRGYDTLVCLLACLSTGRVYLPCDARWPARRLDLVLAEAGCSRMLDVRPDRTIEEIDTGVVARATPTGGLAYIIFTSGSTGTPKGVMVSELALHERLVDMVPFLECDGPVHFVLNTSISFDISLVEQLLPLLVGASIVCPPTPTADPAGFTHTLVARRATHFQATPSLFKLLGALEVELPPELHVWCGGEPLDERLARRLVARHDVVKNLYGPTEATIWCTRHDLTPDDLGSVGSAFGGTEVTAPDATPACHAELRLTGRGLAEGYLRAEHDTGRFVRCDDGSRTYLTGDLGYVDELGRVHVSGRADDQVKINGYRLELNEIEAAADEFDGVVQSVAIVAMDDASDSTEHLALAVVARADVSLRALRQPVLRA